MRAIIHCFCLKTMCYIFNKIGILNKYYNRLIILNLKKDFFMSTLETIAERA